MKALNILMMGAKQRAINGYLYNGWAAEIMELPNSWEIPTQSDFEALIAAVTDGGDLKEAGLTHWNTPNTGAVNTSNFTGFGSGSKSSTSYGLKQYLQLASNTAGGSGVYYLNLFYDSVDIQNGDNFGNDIGYSLRAIYRGLDTPANFIDYNGNIYDVVQIGGVWWTKQNLKTTYLNSTTQITKNTGDWASIESPLYAAYNNDESLV